MIKEFKKPDLKAPRCRKKAHQVLNKTFMEEFGEKYPEYAHLTLNEAYTIVSDFNQQIWNEVVHTRNGVDLPERIGHIFIGTCVRAKKLNVNYGDSIKNDVRLRHRNFESDNFLAKIFYTNYSTKYNLKHKELWNFIGIREFKREVAKVYPEKWKMYLQVENKKHISKYLKEIKQKDYFTKIKESFVIDPLYNEFEIN